MHFCYAVSDEEATSSDLLTVRAEVFCQLADHECYFYMEELPVITIIKHFLTFLLHITQVDIEASLLR